MVLWQVIFWAIISITLITIEFVTTQLVSIWFGLSAMVVFGLCFTGINFTTQLIIFAVVSGLLIVATRPFTKKFLANKVVATNVDAIIGCECIVTIDVSHEVGGRVSVNGKDWAARTCESQENITLAQGEKCIVEEIKGVTLIVRTL